MERLTSEQVEEIIKCSLGAIKTSETYQQVFRELYTYKKLEEEIGCPLEVRCKLFIGVTIYDKNGNSKDIEEICKSCFGASDGKEIIYCFYSNYKKTWWLKEDRSE